MVSTRVRRLLKEPAPRLLQGSLLEEPGFGGLDEGSLGGAAPQAVTGDHDSTSMTITSITVTVTSSMIVITSSFHVVNAQLQARTAAASSCTSLPHFWGMAARRNSLTHRIVLKAAV